LRETGQEGEDGSLGVLSGMAGGTNPWVPVKYDEEEKP